MRPAPRTAARALLLALALAAPAPLRAQVEVERLELSVQLAPESRTVFAKSKLVLANRGRRPLKLVEFAFPAPFGSRVWVSAVWDERGELAWMSDPVEPGAPRALHTGFRKALPPGKKGTLLIHYEIDLKEFDDSEAAVGLHEDAAWLRGAGWYPLPAGAAAAPEITLTVRLPKSWTVESPVGFRRIEEGTRLAGYEFHLQRVEAGQILLRAGGPAPPKRLDSELPNPRTRSEP
jgi:hypothetical protein